MSLNDVKENKIHDLKVAFLTEIRPGLNSDALGTDHIYNNIINSDDFDNLEWILACVSLTSNSPFETPLILCENVEQNIELKARAHNKDQCAQLLADYMSITQNLKTKFRDLKDQVNAATSEEEVEAITWDGL